MPEYRLIQIELTQEELSDLLSWAKAHGRDLLIDELERALDNYFPFHKGAR